MIRSIRNQTMAALAVFVAVAVLRVAAPLPAQAKDYTTVGLEWTAPGDDGNVGTASQYDLRYRTVPVSGTDTLSWWNAATRVTGLPNPHPAGSTDSMRVTGLTSGTTYYFIIRAADEWQNWSGYSNLASDTTLTCDAPTSAPGSFQAVADTGRVDLSWSGTDPKATMTHIYRGTGTTGTLSLRATLSDPNATNYTDTQVNAGTTYRYRVAWAASCADGPSTSTKSVTLPGTPPPPPPPPPPPAPTTDAAKVHAYPNPASGSSSVQFVIHVPEGASQGVLIRLYDLSGRWIATVADASYAPGDHTVSWNRVSRTGRTVSPGYYEAIGTVGGTKVRQRVLLTP